MGLSLSTCRLSCRRLNRRYCAFYLSPSPCLVSIFVSRVSLRFIFFSEFHPVSGASRVSTMNDAIAELLSGRTINPSSHVMLRHAPWWCMHGRTVLCLIGVQEQMRVHDQPCSGRAGHDRLPRRKVRARRPHHGGVAQGLPSGLTGFGFFVSALNIVPDTRRAPLLVTGCWLRRPSFRVRSQSNTAF